MKRLEEEQEKNSVYDSLHADAAEEDKDNLSQDSRLTDKDNLLGFN